MQEELGSLCAIRAGLTFRGRDAITPDADGTCRLIRIADLDDDGVLASDLALPRFTPADPVASDHFLRQGDILFPNRGTRTNAHVYRLPFANVVAGAQFSILRPTAAAATPEYLAWYLRSAPAAAHFATLRRGSVLPTLQRADLASLSVPIPSLARQQTIVELDALAHTERQLTAALLAARSHLVQSSLLHAASR